METKDCYTKQDCLEIGYNLDIKGKVVVLDKAILPAHYPNQLFYCMSDAQSLEDSLLLISLSDGQYFPWNSKEVLGVLKPEHLPETAKLHLSQIRPEGALQIGGAHEAKYMGYSFLADGRYASGVWLSSQQEVMDYVAMQKPYQYRLMICDSNDFCILEIIQGQLIYPLAKRLSSGEERDGVRR